jgi:hypothetical protein
MQYGLLAEIKLNERHFTNYLKQVSGEPIELVR